MLGQGLAEATAEGTPPVDEVDPGKMVLDSLPKGSGRFALVRALTTGAQRCDSASIRRRVGGDTTSLIVKQESFETSGIGFGSGSKRFRRSIFPEHDQTHLGAAEWANGTSLDPEVNAPDVVTATRLDRGPHGSSVAAALASGRRYKIVQASNTPRLILDKILESSSTEVRPIRLRSRWCNSRLCIPCPKTCCGCPQPKVGPGCYNPTPPSKPRVRRHCSIPSTVATQRASTHVRTPRHRAARLTASALGRYGRSRA